MRSHTRLMTAMGVRAAMVKQVRVVNVPPRYSLEEHDAGGGHVVGAPDQNLPPAQHFVDADSIPSPTMADDKHDESIDKLLEAMVRTREADGTPRKPVTYDEFQKVLDSTPLFMRETPKETEGDYVLEALKSLVFEGEGDGELAA